jgi:hypothetical protein
MYVPIDDEDAFNAEVFACVCRSNRHVIEHAESHAHGGASVVAGGANDTECGVCLLLDDCTGGGHGTSGCGEGSFPGGLTNLGVTGAEMIIARANLMLCKFEIGRAVDEAQVGWVHTHRRLKTNVTYQARCFES